MQLGGPLANTYAGTTTVTAGTLQLNKPAGVSAIGGNLTISGTATLLLSASEQIPDTATLTITSTSGDVIPTSTGLETVGNVNYDPGLATAQLIMRNGFTVNGNAAVNSGILGVASSASATVNTLTVTGGFVRIAGNGGPSVLNVLAGGINASGGEIQVKFNTNNQDATLNLGGNYTGTGNVLFTNAGYTGINANVINLTGPRTFDIAAGTTTSIAPDLAGSGSLTKTGNGTLLLTSFSSATQGGGTIVSAGTCMWMDRSPAVSW
jgi:autotransporter-associated beta strand protein